MKWWQTLKLNPAQHSLALAKKHRNILAQEYHPDGKNPSPDKMIQINLAYEEAEKFYKTPPKVTHQTVRDAYKERMSQSYTAYHANYERNKEAIRQAKEKRKKLKEEAKKELQELMIYWFKALLAIFGMVSCLLWLAEKMTEY